MKPFRVRRLSATTNVCDTAELVKTCLKGLGIHGQVGATEVWVRVEGVKTVAVGPTEASVQVGGSSKGGLPCP